MGSTLAEKAEDMISSMGKQCPQDFLQGLIRFDPSGGGGGGDADQGGPPDMASCDDEIAACHREEECGAFLKCLDDSSVHLPTCSAMVSRMGEKGLSLYFGIQRKCPPPSRELLIRLGGVRDEDKPDNARPSGARTPRGEGVGGTRMDGSHPLDRGRHDPDACERASEACMGNDHCKRFLQCVQLRDPMQCTKALKKGGGQKAFKLSMDMSACA